MLQSRCRSQIRGRRRFRGEALPFVRFRSTGSTMSKQSQTRANARARRSVAGVPQLTALSLGLMLALPALAQQQAEDHDRPIRQHPRYGDGDRLARPRPHRRGNRRAGRHHRPAKNSANTGAMEMGQVLQMLEPSFNFSRTTVSDGTDILRPATLRALGPDQVLVLVNGKRRHQQALVNVQQTIAPRFGRHRHQRDPGLGDRPHRGAARRRRRAVRLRRDRRRDQHHPEDADRRTPTCRCRSARPTRATAACCTVGVNTGFKLGDGGFINLTAEYRDREETNRAGPDSLRVEPAARHPAPRRCRRQGRLPVDERRTAGRRAASCTGSAACRGAKAIRRASSAPPATTARCRSCIPTASCRTSSPRSRTRSLAVGYRRPLNDAWDMDLSVNHGRSEFGFHEKATRSTSAGGTSRSIRQSGGRHLRRVADRSRHRHAGVRPDHGEPRLPRRGRLGIGEQPAVPGHRRWNGARTATRSKRAIRCRTPTAAPTTRHPDHRPDRRRLAPAGTQGFPGYSPAKRSTKAATAGPSTSTASPTSPSKLLLGAAVRYEDYSDFGNTTTGKLSARFDASEVFAVRGTVSTGFRAPGVQQAFYSQVSTNLNAAAS